MKMVLSKYNKIDKLLMKLTKREDGNEQPRDEKGSITTDPEKTQKTLETSFKSLYSTN